MRDSGNRTGIVDEVSIEDLPERSIFGGGGLRLFSICLRVRRNKPTIGQPDEEHTRYCPCLL